MKAKNALAARRYMVVVTCVTLQKTRSGALRVLILKRPAGEKEGPGLWTIPGGKVEPRDWGRAKKTGDGRGVWTDILKRACKHELKEETGLAAREIVIVSGREKVFLRRDGSPTLIIVFCAFAAPSPQAKKIKAACRWVRPDELGKYKFIGNVPDDIRFVLQAISARSRAQAVARKR